MFGRNWSRATIGAALAVALATTSCGGASGGPGPDGAGQGLVLVNASIAGVDNVVLNEVLRFEFSEPVDADTIRLHDNPATPENEEGWGTGAIQVREGPQFGLDARGYYEVDGAVVVFRPVLAGTCELLDGGFKPNTDYRVSVLGWPEAFAVQNSTGQPLNRTTSFQFRTRSAGGSLFRDQIPGQPPRVVSWSPEDALDVDPDAPGPAAVKVAADNRIEVVITENLDPCTVTKDSVRFRMFEVGAPNVFLKAPNGNDTGFNSITDQSPLPWSWGSSNSTLVWTPPDFATAQVVPYTVVIEQDFFGTKIVVRPTSGKFPDNALLVLSLTFAIRDFGGQSLSPRDFSFTTENLPPQVGSVTVRFDGDVAPDRQSSTADINTTRSPGRAQGWLLFAGDGNNGTNLLVPSKPAPCYDQADDPAGSTAFDSSNLGNVSLNTGSTRNVCPNETDGSTAVVFEYTSFRVRGGDTVRIIGANPAIILVQGDVVIEGGGILRTRADNTGGAPRGDGRDPPLGTQYYGWDTVGLLAGGTGMAGGGDGGSATSSSLGATSRRSNPGRAGFGSPDYGTANEAGGVGGGEEGSANTDVTTYPGTGMSAQGGGGGGHSVPGGDCPGAPGSGTSWVHTDLGGGGRDYGDDRMRTPEGGSGGGGAGPGYFYVYTSGYYYYSPQGGSGAAGGGFVDMTCQGDMFIYGTIDAAGSRGGTGTTTGTIVGSTGGGGGGSGGGVRLLCSGRIDVSNGTITTAGGMGGSAGVPPAAPNNGGNGAAGRIVLEDSDSVITGQALANLVPSEGTPGFYRGPFDGTRFSGGSSTSQAVTMPFDLGPLSANPLDAAAADFKVILPPVAARPAPGTTMLVEAQGYRRAKDGTVDPGTATGWFTMGHFRDSGQPAPTWFGNANPPAGDVSSVVNAGIGTGGLAGSGFMQIRITFYLPSGGTFGVFDPGPYMDEWTIYFGFDQ